MHLCGKPFRPVFDPFPDSVRIWIIRQINAAVVLVFLQTFMGIGNDDSREIFFKESDIISGVTRREHRFAGSIQEIKEKGCGGALVDPGRKEIEIALRAVDVIATDTGLSQSSLQFMEPFR